MTRHPHLIGHNGPAVIVPARIAAVLEAKAGLSALRQRLRGGRDTEVIEVLEALRAAAVLWRGSATGTEVATEPEPATRSSCWVTTGEAADLVGVSSRAIRKAIAEGRLQATEVGGRYRVAREDLEHFRAARKERQ